PALTEERDRLANELASLTEQQAETSTALGFFSADDQTAPSGDLAAQAAAAAALLSDLRGQNDDLNARLAAVQDDQRAVAAELADNKAALADLEQERDALQAAAAERDQFEAQLATLSEERDGLEARIAELEQLEQQLAALAEERDALESEVANTRQLEAQLAALTRERNTLQADLDAAAREASASDLQPLVGELEGARLEGSRLVLPSALLFASGSAEISQGGAALLAELAPDLANLIDQSGETVMLRIDGHTDPVPMGPGGPYADNWELSAERALSVLRFMSEQGVPAERMLAAGFGDTQPTVPIAGESQADKLARDRRIEISVVER
ncbi:MAG: OmpA family protein, partial [Geminicoccaceae bacterium]